MRHHGFSHSSLYKVTSKQAPRNLLIEDQISKVRQGVARLIDSYAESLIDKSEFEPRITRLRQRLARLEEQRQALTEEAALHGELQLIIGRLEDFATKLHDGLETADWASKRDLIRALVKRVEVTRNEVNVVFRIDPYPSDNNPEKKVCNFVGGESSPVIANLTLDGLERLLRAHYPPNTKRAQRAKVNLVRYCDDFIITGSSQAVLEQEVKPLVEHFLHERGLELSQAKTHITHIENGFDFLGQHVRKYAGKLLIKPAPKKVHTFLGNIRHIVKANKQATAGHLIAQLNPIIRGWANYHRHVVSKATFIKVDTTIFQTLWSWATRRHPKKPGRWIAQKYFPTRHGRRWTFVGTCVGHRGQPQELTLCRAGDVPIQRHVKIKGTANPYDPQWEVYFEERLRVKMTHDLKGRRQLLYLWKQQDGLCPVCHQPITRLTGWHNHHRVWRTYGGSDMADNRVLLHPTCHRQVHSQALDGAPSRSARSV